MIAAAMQPATEATASIGTPTLWIATIAGVVLILLGAVLLAIPLLAAREAKREASATEPVGVEPGVPTPA